MLGDFSDVFHGLWRAHVGPDEAIARVVAARDQAATADRELDAAVREARAQGATWAMLANALEMSRSSAHARWRESE